MQSDIEYFRGRAQEEIDASLAAHSTVARKAHLELAHRYSELADTIERSAFVQPGLAELGDPLRSRAKQTATKDGSRCS